jgi:hypothetical protein
MGALSGGGLLPAQRAADVLGAAEDGAGRWPGQLVRGRAGARAKSRCEGGRQRWSSGRCMCRLCSTRPTPAPQGSVRGRGQALQPGGGRRGLLLLPPLAIEGLILKGGQVLPLDVRPTPPAHNMTVRPLGLMTQHHLPSRSRRLSHLTSRRAVLPGAAHAAVWAPPVPGAAGRVRAASAAAPVGPMAGGAWRDERGAGACVGCRCRCGTWRTWLHTTRRSSGG